jgi:exopolysaccharide biosynthesis polyprenyl glycosylphosphotransferase
LKSARKYPSYKYLLAGLDFATSCLAFVSAVQLRGLSLFQDLFPVRMPTGEEAVFLVACGLVTVLTFQYFNLYKINVFLTVVDHSVQLLKGILSSVLVLALLSFFTKSEWFVESRLVLGYFGVLLVAYTLVVRVLVFRTLFFWLSSQRIYQRRVGIVGAGEAGKRLAVNIFLHPYSGLKVAGFLDDEKPIGTKVFGEANVIGRIEELPDIVKVFRMEEMIICLENTEHSHLMEVMDLATQSGVLVKISSPMYEVIPSRIFMERYGGVPVVSVSPAAEGSVKRVYKRVFDLALASLGLALLSPVYLLIAVAIKLDSRGPVFFSQTRIGKDGRAFQFYKFRSMKVGSDNDEDRKRKAAEFVRARTLPGASSNGSTKIVNESRVTRVGKWLRQTSLDELPQLFNVIKGEMSLVGPRPCLPYEWDEYQEWHKRRLRVLPGCTGIWQVTARSEVGFEEMVVLDLYYIHNASILMDLRLLMKTIPVMVFGTGAK